MKRMSNLLLLLLLSLFILNQFYPSDGLVAIYTVLTAAIILITLVYSRGMTRYFGIAMVLIGSSILLVNEASFLEWSQSLTKNLPLIVLVLIVPILSIPIKSGDYQNHLAGFAMPIQQKPTLLYGFITGMFTLIGPITNIGSLSIIHSMFERMKLPNELLGRVYVRGFISVQSWSPYFASVFLVVFTLGLSVSEFLPYGLFLSAIQILTALLFFKYYELKKIEFVPSSESFPSDKAKLFELVLVIASLTLVIFTFERKVDLNVSVLIALMVLVFALVWSLYLRQGQSFIKEGLSFLSHLLPQKANEVNLLLAAGFFGVVLSETKVAQFMTGIWGVLAQQSIILMILLTIVFIAFLSFLGVHQIVTISTFIATVSYTDLGIDVLTMALTLLGAWSVSTVISPVTPVNIIVSNLLKEPIFKVIMKYNMAYAVLLTLVETAFIYSLHLTVLAV